MDAHGQIGPEKGNYAGDCRQAAKRLGYAGQLFVKLADRGTSLQLHLALRDKLPLLSVEGFGAIDGVPTGKGYVLVSRVEHGSYWFTLGGYHAPDYVADKLGCVQGDGEIIAEFLTRLAAAGALEEARL